ncbi:MAG: tRNA (adenosine(37)-N6)-threonylcarbamoyltransferase complex ATPase subunit type 1 TsaE [Lachnospiraceae bacterium]
MIIETHSEQETWEVGKKLAAQAKPGQIFALIGDLGVGKTIFTKGMAAGLGISEPVNSPTFTIVQVYEEGRMPFYHFDVYRIGDIEEMDEIGYEDYFYGEGVCLVEWANLIEELMPEQTIWLTIEKDLEKGFDYRRITIEGAVGGHRRGEDDENTCNRQFRTGSIRGSCGG